VDRAEFRNDPKAFNQNQFGITAGAFTDVPPDWAASALRKPTKPDLWEAILVLCFANQEIPKVQAIVALANGLNLTASGSASDIVSTYYTDARVLPTYAVDDVAAATQANVVVNSSECESTQSNASDPCGSGGTFVSSLGAVGQVQPIASNVVAANYIVGRSTGGNQNTQSVQPSPRRNIVDLAASSSSLQH